jgi:hypothetical protein
VSILALAVLHPPQRTPPEQCYLLPHGLPSIGFVLIDTTGLFVG